MNKLDIKTRAMIFNMMVEGNSMRSIGRVVGVSINTVTKLLIEAVKPVLHTMTRQSRTWAQPA